jgi:hypothetical protein
VREGVDSVRNEEWIQVVASLQSISVSKTSRWCGLGGSAICYAVKELEEGYIRSQEGCNKSQLQEGYSKLHHTTISKFWYWHCVEKVRAIIFPSG